MTPYRALASVIATTVSIKPVREGSTVSQRDPVEGEGLRSSTKAPQPSGYLGSSKHKNRPARGLKGTLCPEWTHAVPDGGLASDMTLHDWAETEAQRLFTVATLGATGRRFATARGVAFEAKPTGDGTWHGFPVPWESVPPAIRNTWRERGFVTRRDMKVIGPEEPGDISWALKTDTR